MALEVCSGGIEYFEDGNGKVEHWFVGTPGALRRVASDRDLSLADVAMTKVSFRSKPNGTTHIRVLPLNIDRENRPPSQIPFNDSWEHVVTGYYEEISMKETALVATQYLRSVQKTARFME